MIIMMDNTCVISIRDAPVKLKKEFKELCAKSDKTYREMLQVLIDVYKDKIRWA